jgi:hypothetical protein
MKYKKLGTFLVSLTLVIAIVIPTFAGAQTLPPGFVSKPTKPGVPVSSEANDSKESGVTVFGVTIPGLSWDGLAIRIAKRTLEKITDSTVEWINSGFNGSPVYVTNPGEYFASIADDVAGEFIEKSPQLSSLCSPIQANIRISLQTYYNNTYRRSSSPQCTLSTVVDNVDAFYDDFSKGGWKGWFELTQGSGNNPYIAYLEAQSELDSRIAGALHLEEADLNRGRGFLSLKDSEGNVRTPGAVIEGQLQTVLGSGVRQLELADEFDELIGALMGQLLQKTVFSAAGLAGGTSSSNGIDSTTGGNGGGNSGGTTGGTTTGTGQTGTGTTQTQTNLCMASREFAGIGSPVTWRVETSFENASYLWQGEELDGKTGQSVSVSYSSTGLKSASVTITGTESGQSRTSDIQCENSVDVIDIGGGIIPL